MADQTRRQKILALLKQCDQSFEGLRYLLRMTRPLLEDDLHHVAKTAHRNGDRLVVTPACCESCEFVFRDRGTRHFRTPTRCPKCRSERISDALFRLEPNP